jgi:hypothetical protein
MTFAVPSATPVTVPFALTVATLVLDVLQDTVRPETAFPDASFGVAVACTVCPATTVDALSVTSTVATVGGGGGGFVPPSPDPPHAVTTTTATVNAVVARTRDRKLHFDTPIPRLMHVLDTPARVGEPRKWPVC